MVRAIGSASEFDALVSSKKPVLVKFCATWCGSCRRFVPTFEALATQYPGVEFVTVDVDGVQEVFNAQFAGCPRVSLPSFKHFKAGSEVGNFVSGADEESIRKLLGGSGSGGGADRAPSDSTRYFSDAHDGTYLGGYARYGARAYRTLDEAMKACLEDASAGGVTQEGPGKFTVRKGTQLGDSPSGEVSWLKTGLALRDTILERVRPGGSLAMSGVRVDQVDDVLGAYASHFATSEVEREIDGWVLIACRDKR